VAVDSHTVEDALRAHCADCAAARGRWHGAAGALQALHAVLQPRLMSTLLASLSLLAGALWLA
jgi:hypothetical protein